MQPMHYEYRTTILMGVLSVAVVEFLAKLRNREGRPLSIPGLQASPLVRAPFAAVALLAPLVFASAAYAASSDTAATAAADKALYAYVSRHPLHRGYMYCLVAIEYSGDYQSRFCPGSRGAIILAQKALKQPLLDMHDDGELRRILLMIAKSAKESRDAQPEYGAEAPVAPSTLEHIYRRYEKDGVEQPFLYCYADILYFAESDNAYCRYTIAKLNVELFEGSERLLPDDDPPVLFSILKSIISKEKP
ncbi:hypothetical protein [Rhizobium johnstonii]|uniref:hypothetical protein n=1 Tax=Rhizobium johnstonii TaxID=3019933 RepID=UPI003F9CE7DF